MKRLLVLCMTIAAAGVMALPAQAAWLPAFSGNNQFGPPVESSDGVVSFAVWENLAGNDWTVDLGVNAIAQAGSVLDSTARYVYLYQVFNNDFPLSTPAVPDASLNELRLTGAAVDQLTSYGILGEFDGFDFDGAVVFADSSGQVGVSNNQALGSQPMPNGAMELGVSPTNLLSVDGSGAVREAEAGFFSDDMGTTALQWTFLLPTGTTTTIMFATSHSAPTILGAELHDGFPNSDVLPMPSPPPAALALLLTGLPGLGMVMLRRKKAAAE